MSGIPDQPRRRLAIVPEHPEAVSTLGTRAAQLRTGGVAGIHGGSPELDGALTSVLDAISGLRAPTTEPTAAVIGQASSILDELAAELAAIHDALEQQAHTASRYGVKIGTDGRPPPVLAGSPADAAAASERHWALAYQRAYEQAMAEARQARQHAASQLTDLSVSIGGLAAPARACQGTE